MIPKGARARLRGMPHLEGTVGYWHDWRSGDAEPDEPLAVPYPYTFKLDGRADPFLVLESDLEVIDP